jgi:diguanylate cyclase (GGDEF)-like protein
MDEPEIYRLKAENAELKTLLAAAEAKAAIDNLTGLPNESVVEMTLERELGEVKRGKQKLLVLYMDLNHFKKVNDTWGHDQGDKVLHDFAQAARKGIRTSDFIGRLHGDEFVVIARLDLKYSPEDIGKIIERIYQSANSVNCSPNPEEQLPLTINIGGVVVNSGSNLFVSEILKAADINLYQSKNHEHSDATISIMGKEVVGDMEVSPLI